MLTRRRIGCSDSEDLHLTILVDDSSIPVYGPEVKETSQTSLNTWTEHLQSTGHQLLQTISNKVSYSTSAFMKPAPIQTERPNEPTFFKNTKLLIQSTDSLKFETNKEKEVEFIMTARDRSTEFGNAIHSLQSRNIQRAFNIRDPKRVKQMQTYAEFMMIAKNVGKNIASTYTKLEKLTLLAKKKSLFDDRPTEIQELTYIIKGDLNSLNQQIARLQDVSKSQRKHGNGKHLLTHSSNMVVALQAKLANMSTDFKHILEVRTENLKHQKSRRDQFSQGGFSMNTGLTTRMSVDPCQQQSLLIESENDTFTNEKQPLMQKNQMLMYDESDNYLQERAETMQNIESTIVELGGIFQQLAHMVKEQEEIVERIDTNILDVGLNVDMAHNEILKYFRSVSKNRALMIKIFGVLIFFFIFFVILMS